MVRSSAYSTAVGLAKYGAGKVRAQPRRVAVAQAASGAGAPGWGARIGSWFKEVF